MYLYTDLYINREANGHIIEGIDDNILVLRVQFIKQQHEQQQQKE